MGHKDWRQGITANEELELFRIVARGKKAEAGLEAAEKKSIALGADERRRLESEKVAGRDACAQLATAYRAFADSRARVCYKATGKRFALDELRSHAMVALYPLLKRFQPEDGVPFPGYASQPLIREIKRLAYGKPLLGGNRTQQDLRRLVHRTKAALEQARGGPVPPREIAEALELEEYEVALYLGRWEPVSIDDLAKDVTDDDRHVTFPRELMSDPAGRQTGAALFLGEVLDSMREFFDGLLADGGGSAEQQRLIEKIRRSLRGDESLLELREWLLETSKLEPDEQRSRPLEALQWRLLISAIGRHYVNRSPGGPPPRPEKRTPAHPSGTDALERRARRRQVVDGRTPRTIRASRGSA